MATLCLFVLCARRIFFAHCASGSPWPVDGRWSPSFGPWAHMSAAMCTFMCGLGTLAQWLSGSLLTAHWALLRPRVCGRGAGAPGCTGQGARETHKSRGPMCRATGAIQLPVVLRPRPTPCAQASPSAVCETARWPTPRRPCPHARTCPLRLIGARRARACTQSRRGARPPCDRRSRTCKSPPQFAGCESGAGKRPGGAAAVPAVHVIGGAAHLNPAAELTRWKARLLSLAMMHCTDRWSRISAAPSNASGQTKARSFHCSSDTARRPRKHKAMSGRRARDQVRVGGWAPCRRRARTRSCSGDVGAKAMQQSGRGCGHVPAR
eukprot:scaffold4907_cov122-Isochrysis_galbana.AAC.3